MLPPWFDTRWAQAMDFHKHYHADYERDTGDLTLQQHGIYMLLLNEYYRTEAPIPATRVEAIVMARSSRQRGKARMTFKRDLELVLGRYFRLGEDACYHQKRADLEVQAYKDRAPSVGVQRLNDRNRKRLERATHDPPKEPENGPRERQENVMRTPKRTNGVPLIELQAPRSTGIRPFADVLSALTPVHRREESFMKAPQTPQDARDKAPTADRALIVTALMRDLGIPNAHAKDSKLVQLLEQGVLLIDFKVEAEKCKAWNLGWAHVLQRAEERFKYRQHYSASA